MAAAGGASRIYFAVMDRRVKERLIGASILVAFVVLIVPELLSGPKPNAAPVPTLPAAAPEPIRNVTVDLSTSKAPADSEPEPAPQAAAPAASSANLPAAPTPPSPTQNAVMRPAPVESAAPSPTSAVLRSWSVQLGSFASRANADNLTRQVKGLGFSVFVLPGGSGTSLRYRVRVGPLADRESAERMAAKLKAAGHAGSLVAPAA
jgi:DedD protein